MKMSIFLDKHLNVKAENKLLKFFVVLIGIAQIANMAWNYSITRSARTIVIPAGLNARMEISDRGMTEDAVRQYVRYAFGLALNYSPVTVRGQFDELLALYSPAGFAQAKTSLYALAEDVENAKVSNSFYIQRMALDPSGRAVEVQGIKRQYAGEVKLKDANETYVLEYTVSNGRFMIEKIYLKENRKEKEPS